MLTPQPVYRTSNFWRRVIPAVLFLLWLASFSREIRLAFDFFMNGGTYPATGLPESEYRYAILVLLISLIAFIAYFYASVLFVSQFVLPVKLPKHRQLVYERLLRYLSGTHGPAVFIREGSIVGSFAELQSSLPGVAFVDANSGIVLERQPFAARSETDVQVNPGQEAIDQAVTGVVQAVEGTAPVRQSKNALARAVGPGIVFTQRGERIKGVVNLRNHSKIAPNVPATTRDGFQVQGTVVAIFSLGSPPDVVRVGFCAHSDDPDPFQPENLRGIKVVEGRITGFTDELDEADQQEAYIYAMRARPAPVPMQALRQIRSGPANPIYSFDPDRIFRAVYADARRVDNDQVESWQELPTRVASEIFKTMLAAERYTDLYMPDDSQSFPLWQTFRPKFGRTVRNQGVLSFQFVRSKDGQPFSIGQEWNEDDLEFLPTQPLRGTKVLRDRGIRLITATFSEISPINDMARDNLLDFWRAKQKRDADLKLAPYDYESIRTSTVARALAHREIIASLRDILEDSSMPREAVALRFLQAMQSLAKDPDTERILPAETVKMIDNFQSWFWGKFNQGGNSSQGGNSQGQVAP